MGLADKIQGNSKSIDSQDLLNEIQQKPYGYRNYLEIAGSKVVVKKYADDDVTFRNYQTKKTTMTIDRAKALYQKMISSKLYTKDEVPSPEKLKKSANQSSNWYNELSDDEQKQANQDRAGRRRKKKIEMLARANFDKLNTKMELTFGDDDIADLCRNVLSNKQLEWLNIKDLEGIKKFDNIDNNQLREQVRQYLADETNRYDIVGEDKGAIEQSLECMISDCKLDDIEQINHQLDLFRRKVNRLLDYDYKYILVFELGEQNERLHCHILCNISGIEQSKLQQKWGNGIVHLKKMNDESKASCYVSKYASKQADNSFFACKKKYRVSRGLKKSQEVTRDREVKALVQAIEGIGEKVFSTYVDNEDNDCEFSKSYQLEVYELETREIYEKLQQIRSNFAKKMFEVAQDKVASKVRRVRLDYENELEQTMYKIAENSEEVAL